MRGLCHSFTELRWVLFRVKHSVKCIDELPSGDHTDRTLVHLKTHDAFTLGRKGWRLCPQYSVSSVGPRPAPGC